MKTTDPEVVQRPAELFLHGMCHICTSLASALQDCLAEVRQDQAKYDWRWAAPENSIEMAILVIAEASPPPKGGRNRR